MAARATGWAMLCSASVQEAQDLGAHRPRRRPRIAHSLSCISLTAFAHRMRFANWPGRRRSAARHDRRAFRPRASGARLVSGPSGVAGHGPESGCLSFRRAKTVNPFYAACPAIVQRAMDQFAELTGRRYRLFEYHGAPDAERVIVLMGSGGEDGARDGGISQPSGAKVGVVQGAALSPVRRAWLFGGAAGYHQSDRDPGSDKGAGQRRGAALPGRCERPLARSAARQSRRSSAAATGCRPRSSRRRWSRPCSKTWRSRFQRTISRSESTTIFPHTSLEFDPGFSVEPQEVFRAIFYGLGSDGTVGANKDSIKIIGENTDNYVASLFRL